jgi:NTP pyrophosphatase (non-canonical NTP hydrolase)|tara:strand:+ start:163 stop:522 length:360 start_codon:yes stop_codon:yes gene_type:complete
MADVSDLQNLQSEINDFVEVRDWSQFHTPRNLAMSISIEAAELLECFQWGEMSNEELLSDSKLRQSVEDELADVMIYSLRFCSSLGLDPLLIMREKLSQNHVKYPVKKAKGNSKKYNSI